MNNLIKNELIKITKKKSIYVLLIIAIAFGLLTNCIYKFVYSNLNDLVVGPSVESDLQTQLNQLDPNKTSDVSEYVAVKTDLEVNELSKKYEKDSWQRYIAENKIKEIIFVRNQNLYEAEKNEQTQQKLNEIQGEYENAVRILDEGNDGWKQFALADILTTKIRIETMQQQKETMQNATEKREVEKSIKQAERTLEVLQSRLDHNIPYGNDDVNMSLDQYIQIGTLLDGSEDKKPSTYLEKVEYNNNKENYEISKYVVETGKDVTSIDSSRGILQNVYYEYMLFIVIMIVIIAGTIVSSEFEKGTIKLLLIKPYSRIKILLAKYIAVVITVLGSMLAVVIIQLILGGIFFGFDSLSIPTVRYDFTANKLVELNNFQFLGMQTLAVLPEFLLIATITFMIATLSTNSALSITIGIMTYIAGGLINTAAISLHVKALRFFPSMNWDLTQYLFGRLPQIESMSFAFSIIMCIVYFVVLMGISLITFKKKNIKNV